MSIIMLKYFIIYKPYGMLSQFTKEAEHHRTLGELANFPADVYPVGRLDKDSEGLLILTNDKKLNHRLLNPNFGHKRTYVVQVDNTITDTAIKELEEGVSIKVGKGKYFTKKAIVERLLALSTLPERNPPVRFRKEIPTSWIKITLIEGKNRQVRKMCAAVGFPVLRLVRTDIENLNIGKMEVGEVIELSKRELFPQLHL